MLSWFDVTHVFQDCIWFVYTVLHNFILIFSEILLWNALRMSNKFDKILLKWLNSRILKYERLNWSKVSKLTNSKIHWKLKDKNIFNP